MNKLVILLLFLSILLSGCGQSNINIESSTATTFPTTTTTEASTTTTASTEQIVSTTNSSKTSTSIISIETKPHKEIGIKWKIPLIMQNPELPTGCEITSITMIANFYGYDYDKLEMNEKYLSKSNNFYWENGQLYGPSPQKYFMGNPKETRGYGLQCFSRVWVESLNKMFEENNSSRRAIDISGLSLSNLEDELDLGPILISASIDMTPAKSQILLKDFETKEDITTYRNFHCVVLVGYDEDYYYINDPLGTFSKLEKAQLEKAYNSTGQQAVIVQ